MMPDGRLGVKVYPAGFYDRLLMNGVTAEVVMARAVTAENLSDHMGSFYRSPPRQGKVALVLGAGLLRESVATVSVLGAALVLAASMLASRSEA